MSTPKIRFKGFTDDWEQRKFGDNFKLSQGLQVPVEKQLTEQQENTEQFIRIIDVTQDGEPPRFVYNPTGKGRVESNDIFFVRYGAVGTVGYGYNGVIANNLFKAQPLFKAYNKFFYQHFSATNFNIKLREMSASTSMPAVNFKALNSLNFCCPCYKEQMKVGEYFSKFDKLIILHRRKCDELQKVKKYMLQKMFPKKEEKVPEIRFAGFIGDWEQRKLGDVAVRVQGNDGRMNLPTLTISAANGWMNQVDRFSGNIAGKEQKNYTLLHKGELSYNHGNSKLAKYGMVFSLQDYDEALVPRVYHSFRIINGNADFIEYYFATKILDRELAKLISSGARMDGLLNINYDDFMGIKMKLPSVEEQEMISKYFRKIDNLIALHQRKCDTLKETKKYMLQNMFPKN